ncbi:hypothetical protein MNEG_4803 [Monoraphidium neglectum]|uniref:Uncharacterized protein n=1 Tax=Monoraphidium neglectum TaxID=145388 RepID=A0A0D2MRY8_9CHLO|nr:hypothetical protein MNEG_4803 [Monoraphidium neglectum]KIZ03157.1 hypothetical protein MNEG_4803 [Monoraphidium neglectum]|eukprot:XP_013902176.1 hypothetical protein MNEG_4803 [Monoraphidium neglectum]
MCPGNLLINGGFELPNTEALPTEKYDPNKNSCWGWYYGKSVPGWYVVRPDGQRCVTVDWMGDGVIEVARAALTRPVEGRQYGELLPNATGAYCQDVAVTKGAKYKLSWWYGRLVAKAPTDGKNFKKGDMTVFWTSADAAGFKLLQTMNTRDWPMDNSTGIYQPIWKEYKVEFTAPEDKITLAFINGIRSSVCACGSLIDAICLQKA